jgi:hypothetical protein
MTKLELDRRSAGSCHSLRTRPPSSTPSPQQACRAAVCVHSVRDAIRQTPTCARACVRADGPRRCGAACEGACGALAQHACSAGGHRCCGGRRSAPCAAPQPVVSALQRRVPPAQAPGGALAHARGCWLPLRGAGGPSRLLAVPRRRCQHALGGLRRAARCLRCLRRPFAATMLRDDACATAPCCHTGVSAAVGAHSWAWAASAARRRSLGAQQPLGGRAQSLTPHH